MTQPFRIPTGGRVDRSQPISFTFDGKRLEGLMGDTLASALLANGIHLVGRSFKYHRPRGIMTAGSDEPNALMRVGIDPSHQTPNTRATEIELHDGLEAQSQNHWPSLRYDLAAVADFLSPLVPAGFYYKTFMWPKRAWQEVYEPVIRALAGLGRAPTAPDASRYAQRYAHCDVLVIGGGPAGLSAASAAAESGARVMLCDEQFEFGGSLLAEPDARMMGKDAWAWIKDTVLRLAVRESVTLLRRTTAFGFFRDNMVGLAECVSERDPAKPRERLWHVRSREVVFATGAIERPLVFPGNDRPGIMLAGAARAYLHRFGVKPGTRAVVVTGHDSAYRAALDLAAAGIEIAAIVDLRATADEQLSAAARAAGLPILTNAAIANTTGRLRVNGVHIVEARAGWSPTRRQHCDLVLMSQGFTPSVHLFSQSGGALRLDERLGAFVPGASVARERSAGACRGIFELSAVIKDGFAAGDEAAKAAGFAVGSRPRPWAESTDKGFSVGFSVVGPTSGTFTIKSFVDFQNDVTAKDIELAAREGFRSVEQIKRYTTAGMATDQGKTSNVNAFGIAAAVLDKPIAQLGHTTFRMPYKPVTLGTLAGMSRGGLFDPVRTTPMHEWAAARGAVFEDVGQWKRARYFPQPGEDMRAAVNRECKTVRSAVGILDASTLGKIEVVGRHAAEFMNRMYINDFAQLETGRCRYGIMLREDGFILDDGVVGRIAAHRFHVTTTTGGAARVLAMMEDFLQTEWPELDAWLTSTVDQWAVIAVQGPEARALLAPIVTGIDLSNSAMPHMSVREGQILGVPMRLFRVSFTGELGYEVNVPADYGRAAWEAIYQTGMRYGIVPYGTEAMHVLRAEKGYIIVGQETDGTVTPNDVGLSWAIGKSKSDFVGKRSLARAALADPDRRQLVGLLTEDPSIVLEEGAQLVTTANYAIPTKSRGYVTSAYFSANLDRSIALALVARGRARIGERLFVAMPDASIPVQIVNPVFIDSQGKRLNG
jgi:sarcosine oxidase, subunit alpha